MSAPDAPDLAPMSSGSILLPGGAAPARVTAGLVDVFAVREFGARFPVATIGAGRMLYAAAAPVDLLLVPRLDGAIEQGVAAGDDQSRSEFAAAVAATLGDAAGALDATSLESLTASLAGAIEVAEQREAEAWLRNARASIELTGTVYDETLERIEYSTESLASPTITMDDQPLVRVLRVLGAHEGFDVEPPTSAEWTSSSNPLELVCHKSSLRSRRVTLSTGWQHAGSSSYLAFRTESGQSVPIAILKTRRGYECQGPDDAAPRPLTSSIVASMEPQVVELYAPLPVGRPVTPRDVLGLAMNGSGGAWGFAALMALGVALLGLLTPILTNVVIGTVVPQGEAAILIQIGLALAVAAVVAFIFTLVQSFTVSRISQRASIAMQSAFWGRVLSMPASFFRGFSSGDLTIRVLAVDALQSLVSTQVVGATLAAVFGLVNLVLMFKYDVLLGFCGLAFLIVTCIILAIGVRGVSRHATQALVTMRESNGWAVQMLSGILKIRVANAEARMEAKYLDLAREQAVAMSQQTLVGGRISAWFTFAASGASAVFYLVLLWSWSDGAPLSPAAYMAFASAYGLAFAGIAGLSSLLTPVATAGPVFRLLSPIMDSLPESAGHRQDPGRLSGRIELRDVSFRYSSDGPLVLRGLNVQIELGSMVALVGKSGAGKSTITRLLLGFDTPAEGQILFDGRDLNDLDAILVRRQMGVVVQSGSIMRGSIMENILGSTSSAIDAAWAAAEAAAIAEDIRAMPMGMQTIVDPANISGGQAQRILLARAMVNKPAIVILDEATSALDNDAQASVTEAMRGLAATRIVIAHRLTTIKSADAIIVIDKGTAVEQGTYEELMAKGGIFAEQVRRQIA